MSRIIDGEYYSSLYDDIPEENLNRYALLAEKEVCRVIGPIRWATITEDTFGYEQLKDCICNTMHELARTEKSNAGKGVASVSNDGYSESYAIQTGSQQREELQKAIRAWLSGTGLVGAY